jgi:hypothetical protein
MTRTDVFRLVVGTMVLLSVALTWLVSHWWALFTVFIGLNLVQSSFTRWCLLSDILKKTNLPETRQEGGGTTRPV